MTQGIQILDMCCGSKMFWCDKNDPRALFVDIRDEEHELCDGRKLTISPDEVADFRDLPFEDELFPVVVFDPPHLIRAGVNGWMRKKYGALDPQNWKSDIRSGFHEAFRVLRPDGVLIFKWNETQIRTREIVGLSPHPPVINQRTGKNDKTHWIIFIKPSEADNG